jgi:hypothetical protein
MIAGGGILLGLSIMEAGGAVSATGAGVFLGVVLFTIGGIIAGISAIIAAHFVSDEFQAFAQTCFLGKLGSREPRFRSSPPSWSGAPAIGNNTWPIDIQRAAIHNLLGRFSVETKFVRNGGAGDV